MRQPEPPGPDGPFDTERRAFLGGLASSLAAAGLGGTALAAGPKRRRDPDLGTNVLIFDPSMPGAQIQQRLDAIFREQERAHFTDRRYALLFKPGRYSVDANIGFFTQAAGLGLLPDDVMIAGHVHAEADWAKGMALVNFWRGVENLAVRPPDDADRWAVSQAAPYRRMHLSGDLALDDGGWSSGGFMADCRIDGVIRSGSQQQWFTRNSSIREWRGSNWNMMFMGVEGAPPTSFPEPPFTSLPSVPLHRESRSSTSIGRATGASLCPRCGGTVRTELDQRQAGRRIDPAFPLLHRETRYDRQADQRRSRSRTASAAHARHLFDFRAASHQPSKYRNSGPRSRDLANGARQQGDHYC